MHLKFLFPFLLRCRQVLLNILSLNVTCGNKQNRRSLKLINDNELHIFACKLSPFKRLLSGVNVKIYASSFLDANQEVS